MKCFQCEERIYYDEKSKEWVLIIPTTNWNDYLDDFDSEEISINFCPECGKDFSKVTT